MFEDVEEEGISINPEILLKNIFDLNKIIGKPDREDFEDEDELQANCDSECTVLRFLVVLGINYYLVNFMVYGIVLRQIHGIAGFIFLCHIMGIGKITIALAIHWIQYIFNMMWADIRANSKAHTVHGECPANIQMYKTYGFDCPCSADSTNHWLKERLGVTVAFVPFGFLNSIQNASKAFLIRFWFKAHGTSNASGGDQLKDSTQDLLEGEEVIQEEVYQNDEDESLQESEKPKKPSIYIPRLQNGHVFVITTPDSFTSQFLNKFQYTKIW
ncbi:uncharacterized protein EAF02_000213 [Botrytis sinoallii]|uniref:uncharacterized protein n=1 Tax=Botrytis sinoallii TaxID=1463999 RepID=UPI0018FF730F|nr:uncharacterized protein EAF02_000213 [Botrytis sinoallii]KAF7892675.1 hypothetical protein EAF02_000213 [Botrytis sinoallii]